MSDKNKDDKSIHAPIVAVAAVSGVLVLLLILTLLLVVIMLFHWNRKKSRKAWYIDVKQQNTHTITDLVQCDPHTKPKVEPISRLETINGAYVSTKVKSLDSLLRQHNHSRSVSNTADCNVTITPNPSYNVVMLDASQPMKEPEQPEYDYTYELLASSAASVEVYGNVSDSASDDYVYNSNPSHSLPDDDQDNVSTHPMHN